MASQIVASKFFSGVGGSTQYDIAEPSFKTTAASTTAAPASGIIAVDPTYITSSGTFDPYGYALVYITASANVTIAAPHFTGQGGTQERIMLVNFGANTVTITGSSAAHELSTASGTDCPDGCSNTAYSLAGNSRMILSQTRGRRFLPESQPLTRAGSERPVDGSMPSAAFFDSTKFG